MRLTYFSESPKMHGCGNRDEFEVSSYKEKKMTVLRPIKEKPVKSVGTPAGEREIGELSVSIHRSIHRAAGGGIRELRVHFHEGSIILSGYCRKFFIKQVAQEVAMDIYMEGNIINNIEVL